MDDNFSLNMKSLRKDDCSDNSCLPSKKEYEAIKNKLTNIKNFKLYKNWKPNNEKSSLLVSTFNKLFKEKKGMKISPLKKKFHKKTNSINTINLDETKRCEIVHKYLNNVPQKINVSDNNNNVNLSNISNRLVLNNTAEKLKFSNKFSLYNFIKKIDHKSENNSMLSKIA